MTRSSSEERPLLSAAMIVRDEAEHLAGCLDSLQGVVDEVVVVDTGSVDDTMEVAAAHGAVVSSEPWTGDFSRARNAALRRATGQWILYIDADERLQPIRREAVETLLDGAADHVAFRVLLRPFVGSTQAREYRLWRNDERIRFVGVIHEKVVPSIQAVATAEGRRIGECDLAIDHLGYSGDQHRKHLRNLPLLHAQLEIEPRNIFNLRHLATVLAALGRDAEAEATLRRAIDVVRTTADPQPGGALVFADLAARQRGTVEVGALIDEGLARFPRDPVLAWVKATDHLDRNEPAAALPWLDQLVAADTAQFADTMSYDARLFGAWAQAARGLCLFQLGRYAESAVAYRAAEHDEPEVEEHRVKRSMAEHLARGGPRAATDWTRTFDVADVAVRFSATTAGQVDAIERATTTLPVVEGPAEVDVTLSEVGRLEVVVWQHADGDVRASWEDDGVLLLGHGSMRARVSKRAATLDGTDDLVRAFRQLLPYVLTHLLAPRDRFVLHGGAIVRDGRAVLLLGPTGSGKSTLAVSAAGAGWTVASDDLVAVRAADSGVEVRGIPKPLLAPGPAVVRAGVSYHPVAGDPRGRVVVTGVTAEDRWYPVVATIVSERSETETEVRPFGTHALLEWLLFSFLAARDDSRLRRYLPIAAELARSGGGRLQHGSTTHAHGQLIDELLAEIAAARR